MRSLVLSAAIVLAGIGQPASAAWHKASSKHFIIYADQNPERLDAFARKLEKFDQAVRLARGMKDPSVGDGNRVTIYVVRNTSAVQSLANDKSGFVAGFYMPRASGPIAFVPQSTNSTNLNADTIFLHEYAHHILLQDLDRPYPEWLVEGFAEFLSTTSFEKNGTVVLGRAAHHRAFGIFHVEGLPLESILAGNYGKITVGQRESIYGRGWLLTHYLTFDEKRRGQLDAYINAIANGTPALDAAKRAFGSVIQLERDLRSYLSKNRIPALFIDGSKFRTPVVDIQPVSAGTAKVLPLRMESKRGVTKQTAEPLAAKVRQVQAAYAGDPFVEVTLAEAEIDADHPEAAEAAADRALASDPRNVEAMIFKGRAMIEQALAAPKHDSKRFAAGRSWFTKANKLDVDDPEPLLEYYQSFLFEGIKPTPNAIDALHYASDLAPQDLGLRFTSAVQFLKDGDRKSARQTLTTIAYTPHGQELAETAQKLIARIDSGDADPVKSVFNDEKAAKAEVGQPK